ncbi:hypothetical protein B1222_10230 [Paenibacillus larvae subsp. pulvifaciens]|nr:hypothetical protein B1222_10230 [Paenibacillus larvae subsp. pulvifaciens]AQZ46685.1 hypothetical protein B5S25_08730 [Paenibacillus larvae subsp. pulvifaciens]MBH0343916.1 hypothetical protein [Paenibacillus larvae]
MKLDNVHPVSAMAFLSSSRSEFFVPFLPEEFLFYIGHIRVFQTDFSFLILRKPLHVQAGRAIFLPFLPRVSFP